MLQEIRVHNLALIDTLLLDLSSRSAGLIVLTGETGAGKSIILQAINLLTGGRGSATWVRSDCDQASIEATFAVRPDHADVQALLAEHALQQGAQCLIRRVLTSDGRTKLYINDQSVTTRLAGELTVHLINIASQHDHQLLLHARNHLDYLDTFGDLWGMRQQFTRLFRRWQQASSELRQLQEKEQDKEQQREFLQFQLDEIHKAAIVAGEDEQLQRERDQLKAAEGLIKLVGSATRLLADSVTGKLTDIRKHLEQAAGLDPALTLVVERFASSCYDLEDQASGLQKYLEGLPSDVTRLDSIAERLAELKKLQRKYGPTLEEVLACAEAAAVSLNELESLEQQIRQVELRVEEVATEALLKAAELTLARRETAAKLSVSMGSELRSLSFPQAVFEVAIAEPEGLGMAGIQSTGRDTVEFFFSANQGEAVKPLARIVSGGELSRLMLAMKCLLARKDQVDTVIFDEVDAGIGGQAAEAVAIKIKELAGHHQVLCITHLPQIAAGADLHFKVEKVVENDRTKTRIQPLNDQQQVAELARMLGGENPTEQTLAYARELKARRSARGSA